jgi:hypothetical protein
VKLLDEHDTSFLEGSTYYNNTDGGQIAPSPDKNGAPINVGNISFQPDGSWARC